MNICEEINNLPSCPNDLKLMVAQLKREIEKIMNDTSAKLLIHDGKIAELTKYIKDNLGNSLRCMIDTMKMSRWIRWTYYNSNRI